MDSQCHFLRFFFNDAATTEIYTLSLHDALPISGRLAHERRREGGRRTPAGSRRACRRARAGSHRASRCAQDRKSTRLNSSHQIISYAVFCLKKKKIKQKRFRNTTELLLYTLTTT